MDPELAYRVGELLYRQRQGLRPLADPGDVKAFNMLRAVGADLTGLFEDHAPGFVPDRFISIVMTGKPE